MKTRRIHQVLGLPSRQGYPLLLTAALLYLVSPIFLGQSRASASRNVIDLRTGKSVENVIANGTIYHFQSTAPSVNLWQVPVPLDGVWMESQDRGTLTWISSLSGASGDSTDCGGTSSGGGGNCPTNNPTCGGVPYDPTTEGCCDGEVFLLRYPALDAKQSIHR